MDCYEVKMPRWCSLEVVVEFACRLKQLPAANKYVLNFEDTQWLPPFALIFLSSEIRRFVIDHPDAEFKPINYEGGNCGYAAHMGFFKSFGIDYGNSAGEARGSDTYIPIKICNVDELKQDAGSLSEVGEQIDKMAQDMTKLLVRTDSGDLYDALSYSIREIVRNVFEHSEADQFGFCAQYWKSTHKVELAIIDHGIGIRQALLNNPYLNITNDHDALNLCLIPGVSGKVYKGVKRNPYDIWENTGFGLYMTSRLCKEGGSFFIASGEVGMYLSERKKRYLKTPFKGTALCLNLNTDRLKSVESLLKKFRKEANEMEKIAGKDITAAKASSLITRDFTKEE